METSRVALIALVCVVFSSQKRISGAEVEMRVRRGDDITLYSDCVWESRFITVWFRNCSEKDHPRIMISLADLISGELLGGDLTRHSFLLNKSTNAYDLLIKNITESDQGLYYCSLTEKRFSGNNKDILNCLDVYHYGNRANRLSAQEPHPSVCEPCVSGSSVSWELVFSVCAVCVLLSSLLSSICVYCLCAHTTKEIKPEPAGSKKRTTLKHNEVGDDEVCYASLDIKNLEKKKLKRKKGAQQTDFSMYSEVRYERTENF